MALPLELVPLLNAVARTENLTRAAEIMGISQPAVSKQVKQLERSMRAKLIERMGRGIRLTGEGKMLASYARRIMSIADEAERSLSDMQQLRAGSLRIGATPSLAAYLLPDALIRFRQRFAGIQIHMETAGSEVLRDHLRDGTIELAITLTPLPSPEFDSSVFCADELVAIVSTDHPLARRASLKVSQLAEHPIIARDPGASQRLSQVERVLATAKTPVHPVLRLGNTEAVKRAVVAGLGVSIVPKLTTVNEVKAGTLVALKLRDVAVKRPIYTVHLTGSKPTKSAVALLCLLKHVVRGTLPGLSPSGSEQPAHPVRHREKA